MIEIKLLQDIQLIQDLKAEFDQLDQFDLEIEKLYEKDNYSK